VTDRSPSTSPHTEPLAFTEAFATDRSNPLGTAMQTESEARDRLAEFAGAWAGSVYQSSPFFGDLRNYLDAYRDAIEARVDFQHRTDSHEPPPLD